MLYLRSQPTTYTYKESLSYVIFFGVVEQFSLIPALYNTHVLAGPTTKMNLFQSVTSALDNTLATDPTAGEASGLIWFSLTFPSCPFQLHRRMY